MLGIALIVMMVACAAYGALALGDPPKCDGPHKWKSADKHLECELCHLTTDTSKDMFE